MVFILGSVFTAFAQTTQGGNAGTPCNVYAPLVSPTYSNLAVANSTGLLGSDNWSNKERLIDNDLSNSASWTAVLLGSAWIEARDLAATNSNVFPAGFYAGMVINDVDLLSLGASVRITTYLDNVEQESQTFTSLLSTLLDGSGRRRVGFITTRNFNRIRLTVNAGLTVVFTMNAFYAEVFKPCQGPEPSCNLLTPLTRPTFASLIEPTRTGFSGVSVGSISNLDNIVNSSTSDFATVSLNVGILASASVSVRNLAETFPAGYFAGFDLSNSSLVGLSLLGNVTLQTYLNGNLRETISASNLVLDAPILTGSNRQTLGFITSQSFNEIRLTLNQPVGVNLGATQIFSAVIKKYCAGPTLNCNESTSWSNPTFPVLIQSNRTGIDGLACIGCSIDQPQRLIDTSLTNFSTISLLAGVGISGSISVQDPITDYAAGTFVGFDVQNTSLLSVDLLNGLTVRTYLNGVLRETRSGLNDLLSIGTSLLTDDGRRTIGFITGLSFDEVRLTVANTVSVNLGTTRVYQAILKRFCEVNIECNQTYFLTEPAAPVVVNSVRTGIDGVACVACSVTNANQVISASTTDFSTITLAAGVLASGNLSVLDGLSTYPQGSVAGFVIQDVNNLLQLDLFNSLSVCTYNNGLLQECATGSQLIDLAILGNIVGSGSGRVNIGFRTTQRFDEIRLTVRSLASVLQVIRVFSGYVDTRGATDSSLNCCPVLPPTVSSQIVQNTCPSSTVNLNALVTSLTPANTNLVWFNGSDPASSVQVVNPTAVGQSGQYFAFYVNQTAPNSCFSPASLGVNVAISACRVKLRPKVFLQGALFGVNLPDTLMRDDLRQLGRLPLMHPYEALTPISPISAATSAVFSTTGPNAIVDWVFIELRNAADPRVIIDSRPALLQRDGDIVEVDGVSIPEFSVASLTQSYFVVVRHRNHLGVMTANALSMTTEGRLVDFRLASTPTFRISNAALNQAQVVVQQGRALWAGNTEPDTQIIYQGTNNDVNPIFNRVLSDVLNVFGVPTFKSRGYLNADVDLNGEAVFQGSGNDLEFIYQNIINNHPGNVLVLPFFTIREQLP